MSAARGSARSTIAKMAVSDAAARTVGQIDPAIVVPIDLIQPNPWNPNVQPDWIYQKELASIKKFGFVDPLTVREIRDEIEATAFADPQPVFISGAVNHYEIIDGEHRWRAAKELGYTELPCWNLGVIDDADARELTVVLNETRGKSDETRLRALLQDLIKRRGNEDEVRQIMPFSHDRFEEILGRMRVDWDALEGRRTKIDPTPTGRWKEIVFRMPHEAAATVERAIDDVKEREGFDESWRALEMICADRIA